MTGASSPLYLTKSGKAPPLPGGCVSGELAVSMPGLSCLLGHHYLEKLDRGALTDNAPRKLSKSDDIRRFFEEEIQHLSL